MGNAFPHPGQQLMCNNRCAEKRANHYLLPRISAFLDEDIYNYRDNVEDLIEKLLLLESTDFYLAQPGKLVTQIKSHQ
jgi:hypothetical protein